MNQPNRKLANPPDWISCGGRMSNLILSMDWSRNPLGSLDGWPQSLRTTVSLCLASNFPISLAWGREHTQIYNDGYWPICGGKHPSSMGQDFRECWASAWPAIGDAYERAWSGKTSYLTNQRMLLDRNGFLEETFFTFSFSPIREERGRVGGLFHPVTETTSDRLSERRSEMLRKLSDRLDRLDRLDTVEEVLSEAAGTLGRESRDLKSCAVYTIGGSAACAQLLADFESPGAAPQLPKSVRIGSDSDNVLQTVYRSQQPLRVEGLKAKLNGGGRTGKRRDMTVLLPIIPAGCSQPIAIVAFGLSPCLMIDSSLEGFLDLLGHTITSAVANVRLWEEERSRSETLAEIDRAKTTFFSNVSHEFRTPLTLMLGPIGEILENKMVTPEDHDTLQLVYRNGLRLQRLVDTLLDFSRVEAGRMKARFTPVAIGHVTRDLASNFQPACERAGLSLDLVCREPEAPVYVDLDMWEKITLNLVSNAFKFTFEGTILVETREESGSLILAVADSGVGIAESEQGAIFDRFRQVEGARGRSHEGTGIGLALVKELTQLHGGEVSVESELGRSSRFEVRIPTGKQHLPPDQIFKPGTPSAVRIGRTASYVEEALRWIPESESNRLHKRAGSSKDELDYTEEPDAGDATKPLLLLADDNADMRDYLSRVLSIGYRVEAVSNGEDALRRVRDRRPEVVVTDIMMPVLDSLSLVRTLRENPATREIPIILLSARAGEDERLDGLSKGADDYLIKPFSARELLARINSQVALARLRRETADHLREVDRKKDEFLATLAHELRNPLAPIRSGLEALPTIKEPELREETRLMMERQVRRLVLLVDDLLDVSRITLGKLRLRKRRVSAREVAEAAVEASRIFIKDAGHHFEVRWPEPDVSIDGDPERLSQVLTNLLNNASKYTPAGGQIEFSGHLEGHDLYFRVRDNGIGIEPDMLHRIFDMFEQEEVAESEEAQTGLGLGLTLVKSLAEMHGGRIRAVSEGRNQGSLFELRLPVAKTPAATNEEGTSAPKRSASGPCHSKRIALADDNASAARILALIMQRDGHEVKTAHNGKDAVALAEAFRAEVVILDIGMPKMNGHEAALKIRQRMAEHIPYLIALTGWGQDEDRARSREVGFDLHLVKPVEMKTLRSALNDIPARPPSPDLPGKE